MLEKDPEDVEHLIHAGVCSPSSPTYLSKTRQRRCRQWWHGLCPSWLVIIPSAKIILLCIISSICLLEFETDEGHTTPADACKGVEDDKNDTIQAVLNDKQDHNQTSLPNETAKEVKESKDTTTKGIDREMLARALLRPAVDKFGIRC